MATNVAISQTSDLPADTLEPSSVEELLDVWRPHENDVYVRLQRYAQDGKMPQVGTLPFDATTEQIKRAWGGGKYRLQLSARHNFHGPDRAHKRGAIAGQLTFELEGDPILRLAGTLQGALKEADDGIPPQRSHHGGASMPTSLPGFTGTTTGAPMSGNLDVGQLLAISFQNMMATQNMMAERAASQAQETRELFVAMMQNQHRDADPLAMLDRILDIRHKIGGGDDGVAGAIVQAIPHLGSLAERIIARLGEKPYGQQMRPQTPPAPRPALAAQGQAQPPQGPQRGPTGQEQATTSGADTGASITTEGRAMLALQTLAVSVTDPNHEPAAVASTLASILGDELSQAMASDPTTARQVVEFAPEMADHLSAIEAVYAELATLYGPDDDDEGQDGDDVASHDQQPGRVQPSSNGRAERVAR